MTPNCLQVIRNEHQALSAMLRSIPLLLSQRRPAGTPPDFAALRAMLFYVDEFPEKRHHRKETELLFPRLRARSTQLHEVLAQLDHDHARGERRIRELEHALLAWEVMGESRRVPFETALAKYIDFYHGHMAIEEREVLPLCEKVLTPHDWEELDQAFAANRDALAGATPEAEYRDLFSRIVKQVPAPVGLGPAATPRAT